MCIRDSPKSDLDIPDKEFESNKKFIEDARSRTGGIKLQGITDLMVHFGKCCNPIPGDEMIGFITRGRGVTVHRSSCKSLPLLNEESDRLIPVEWDVGRSDIFNVRLRVESIDRKGMSMFKSFLKMFLHKFFHKFYNKVFYQIYIIVIYGRRYY